MVMHKSLIKFDGQFDEKSHTFNMYMFIFLQVPLILPLTFLAVCLFLVTFPFYVSPWETGMGIAITLSGIPVYALTIFWENKPKFYRKAISKYPSVLCYP